MLDVEVDTAFNHEVVRFNPQCPLCLTQFWRNEEIGFNISQVA